MSAMPDINTRSLCFFYGTVFVLVAALGMTANPLISATGLFAVNHGHNLVHVLTGLFLLLSPLAFPGREGGLMIVTGAAYGVLGFIGIVTGKTLLLDLVLINAADNFLHIGLALALILSALIAPGKDGIA